MCARWIGDTNSPARDQLDPLGSAGLVLVTYQASSRSRINPKDMISWMDPFTWDVWGTIFAIITAYAIIMFYLERDDTDSVDFDAPEEQGARGLFKSFWLSSVTFIGQLQGDSSLRCGKFVSSLRLKSITTCRRVSAAGHVPGSAMGRIFMQTTAFVAVIIASSYTANLATFLTASRVATAAAQLSSIHDAQSMGSKICVGSLSTASAVLGADYKRVHQVKVRGRRQYGATIHVTVQTCTAELLPQLLCLTRK